MEMPWCLWMLYLMLDQLQQNVLPLYPVGVSFAVACEHCSLSFCTVPLREVWLNLLYRLLQDPLCAQLLLHNQSVSSLYSWGSFCPQCSTISGVCWTPWGTRMGPEASHDSSSKHLASTAKTQNKAISTCHHQSQPTHTVNNPVNIH